MTRLFSFRPSALLVWCAVFLMASSAQAQVVRPSNSIYVMLRGAVAGYYGDLDGNPDDDPDSATPDPGDGFDNPGFGVGGEIGYLFSDAFSFGIGLMYQDLPALNDGFRFAGTTNVQGGEAYQLQALFRWMPLASSRIAPFVEFGGALVSGQGTENERNNGSADEDVFGYGPVGGIGLDIALTPQLGLFLAAQSTVVFPDVALDGADPSAFEGAPGDGTLFDASNDNAEYDILANIGGGLRFAFRAPYTAAEIRSMECPAELEVGESGSFMVMTNDDATRPITTTWQWGDGSTGSGMATSHSFSAPGSYTVRTMVMNEGGEDMETCLVNVVEPPVPATLAGCRASMSSANVGEEVTISATASDADRISVDFGDGTRASALPARHAYSDTGSYTVTITATNQYGSDTCTVRVTVGDSYCGNVNELNPVYFGYGSMTLTADAMSRLDENIEILRRCPDVCVTINAYSDGSEPGDALRISQGRADAVLQYYASQGIDTDRLRGVGRGVDPLANSKEDPGPGDNRSRRADSIPSSCAGF